MSMREAIRPTSMRGWLLLILFIAAMALAFLPLRLALGISGAEEAGLTARSAGGTIWDGRVTEARIGALELGTLDIGMRPQSLLMGRARLDFARAESSGLPLTGSAEAGWRRRALHDVSGSFIGGMVGDVPIGQVTLEGVSAVFSDGRCLEASGRVRVVLAIEIAGFTLRNGLSGAARCDDQDLLLPLAGDSGVERLTLRIDGDGRYTGVLGTGTGSGGIQLRGRL